MRKSILSLSGILFLAALLASCTEDKSTPAPAKTKEPAKKQVELDLDNLPESPMVT